MPRPDERPDDGLIHAWLDGELGAEEATRVERLVADDAEWAAAAAEARGLMAASTRILGALDVVAGDVIPRGGSAAGVSAPTRVGSPVPMLRFTQRRVPTWLRVAAGLVLVAGVGYLGSDRLGTAPTGMPKGDRETGSEVASTVGSAMANEMPSVAPPAPAARAAQNVVEADRAARDEPVATPRSAPPVEAAGTREQTVSAPTSASGVTAEVASDVAARVAVESKSVLGAAAAAPEREVRAKTMQRALAATPGGQVERLLDSPNSVSPVFSARTMDASRSGPVVTGCWLARTTAQVDSIQISLRVVSVVGDTLVLALTPAGAEARVVRESADVLSGRVRDGSGGTAVFRAVRMACAP